jgi:sugar phosphate isomerase/epimerase
VRSPAQALDIALTLGPGVGLCIDTLHVIRSGSGWDDVAALPPERIRHVQMNDGPLEAPHDRVNEAVFDRLMPGQGAFNLKGLLPLLPDHAMIAVEAPSRVFREGEPGERAARLMQSMRDVYGAA